MKKSFELVSSMFVAAVIVAVALGCDKGGSDGAGGGGGGGDGGSAKASTPEFSVSAAEITQAYQDNEVAADSKYKGKTIEITGIVGDIKKDILDDVYVIIGTGKEFEISEVQCFVAGNMVGKAGSLAKGSRITAVGRVDGLMMNVLVKDCRF